MASNLSEDVCGRGSRSVSEAVRQASDMPALPLYIGITDFSDPQRVREMQALIAPEHRRSLAMGTMMSPRSLHFGVGERWKQVWLEPKDIERVFLNLPKVLNVLHWVDYRGITKDTDLEEAAKYCGPHLHAIQLDMTWPSPRIISGIKNSQPHCKIILQVGTHAFEALMAPEVESFIGRVSTYHREGLVDAVLLDKSMGQGRAMEAATLRPYLEALREELPSVGIVLGGGLGPHTLSLLDPLQDRFSDFSIDAQGALRASRKPYDPVEWTLAGEYLRNALLKLV